jgi:hypothetical protein
MEISYGHRFIFIHVYRVGGQSISQALAPYSYDPGTRYARVPLLRKLGQSGRIRSLRERNYGHIKAKELKAALPPEVFDRFFKFAFVRNPWEWLVSTYHYVAQRPDNPQHELFRSFGSFEGFLDWRINRNRPDLQTEFVLSDSGELLVDFVGRFESLAEDMGTVCERLAIEATLPHKNRSIHGDFREYYTPETRALVADTYRDDIEFFGYSFDAMARSMPYSSA